MKPDDPKIFHLFDKQRRYVVPLYQRPYVWNEEDQWEPLLQDVRGRAEAILRKDPQQTPHFLGTIVLKPVETFGRELNAAWVIDGQQRLTTLQLLLVAIRDLAKTVDEGTWKDLEKLTIHDCRMAYPYEKYKVWPTNADRPAFERVLEAGTAEALKAAYKESEPPLLARCYLFFSDSIGNYLKEPIDGMPSGESTAIRLDALFDAFRDLLQVIQIELESNDDPQVIFETINARGVPLLPSDLIRNFLFLEAGRSKLDTDALYKRLWQHYDTAPADPTKTDSEPFWKVEQRQGKYTRPRLDVFLHHYVQYQMASEVNVGRLYQEFQGWWKVSETRDIEKELTSLQANSLEFRRILIPETNTRLGVLARRLNLLDTSTLNPLLLFLLVEAKERIPPGQLDEILMDLESYLIRRSVRRLTTANYNRFFLTLVRDLRKESAVTRDAVRKLLQGEGRKDSNRWPDDTEFEDAWLNQSAYGRIKQATVRAILEAIDLQLVTSKQETVHLGDGLTIEHVMPVNWRENWPEPASSPDASLQPAQYRDKLIHSFGNLTLLTQGLNSAVSDGCFADKRPEIAEQSALRLNVEFQNAESWNDEIIRERGKRLFAIAREIWPHPGPVSAA